MTTPLSSSDEELPIRIRLESGKEIERPTTAGLRTRLERIGEYGDHFLIVLREPNEPGYFIQAYRDGESAFSLEYRYGGDESYQTEVDDPESVLGTMMDWIARKPDWNAAHEWMRS